MSQIKDKDQYETAINSYAAMFQQAGFRGMTANQLRVVAPFIPKSAKAVAEETLDKFFKVPFNQKAMNENPEAALSTAIDVDLGVKGPDGQPLRQRTSIADLMKIAGRGLVTDPETGKPLSFTDESLSKDVAEVYRTNLATFTATARRRPTPEERKKLILQSEKEVAGAKRKPEADEEAIDQTSVETAAASIIAGRMAPSQLSLAGGMGKAGVKFKQAVLAAVNKQNPQFNWAAAESNFQFGKNPATQNTVRFLDNIEKTLPVLESASDDFKSSGVRVINSAILKTKSQFGATDVVKFEFARNILADEIAKVLQGGGTGNGTSDAKLRQAQELLSGDMTPEQLRTVTAAAREMLGTRRASLTQGTYMERPQEPQSAPSAAESARKKLAGRK